MQPEKTMSFDLRPVSPRMSPSISAVSRVAKRTDNIPGEADSNARATAQTAAAIPTQIATHSPKG